MMLISLWGEREAAENGEQMIKGWLIKLNNGPRADEPAGIQSELFLNGGLGVIS